MSHLNSHGVRTGREVQGAFTFIENMIAMAIVALFFSALYALNSQGLYLLNAGRGAAIADKSLQDRIEQLRNCTWSQLTSTSYLQGSVLNTATNDAANLATVTETVTLNSYPIALNPAISVVRSNGSVSIASNNAAIAGRDLVRVDATLTWSAGPGGRTRTASTSTLIAKYNP